MKVQLGKELVDLEGKVINAADGNPAIVGKICIEALLATYADEAQLTGEEKIKRWELAVKIKGQDFIELAAEEIALIKQLVGKAYNPMVVGQTWEVLEGRK